MTSMKLVLGFKMSETLKCEIFDGFLISIFRLEKTTASSKLKKVFISARSAILKSFVAIELLQNSLNFGH